MAYRVSKGGHASQFASLVREGQVAMLRSGRMWICLTLLLIWKGRASDHAKKRETVDKDSPLWEEGGVRTWSPQASLLGGGGEAMAMYGSTSSGWRCNSHLDLHMLC